MRGRIVRRGTFKTNKMSCSAEPGRKTAYSGDIGWRVVWQYIGMNYSFEDIGIRLQIAPSTAHRIFTRFKITGDVAPKTQLSW